MTNVYNAMKCATAEGALGVLVCNWSGKGHITHLPFCWPGFLMGAGLSWNSDCHWVSLHYTSVFLLARISHGGGAELDLRLSLGK